MTRSKMTISAITKRMCMSPPSVYEETKPSNQRMIKMSAIVSSIFLLHSRPLIDDIYTTNLSTDARDDTPNKLRCNSQGNADPLRHSALEVIVDSHTNIFHFIFKKLPARRVPTKVFRKYLKFPAKYL